MVSLVECSSRRPTVACGPHQDHLTASGSDTERRGALLSFHPKQGPGAPNGVAPGPEADIFTDPLGGHFH